MSESNFATLLDELAHQEQILAKAVKGDDDDDKNIASMADGDADDDGASDAEDDETYDDDDDLPEKRGKQMAKSFSIVTDDGREFEAFDGTEMVKALQSEVTALQRGSTEVMGEAVNLIKSFGAALREQRREITALKKSIHELSASGTGRRSATRVTVTDRGTEPTGIDQNPEEIKASVMAKAMSAFDAKKISGLELTTIEVSLRKGQIPDQSILAKIA